MREYDATLADWLEARALGGEETKGARARLSQALDQLERALDHPEPKGVAYGRLTSGFFPSPGLLTERDVSRARALYRRMVQVKGAGKQYLERALLTALAFSPEHGLLPFWLETLEVKAPRDLFAARRRKLSIAAVAIMAIAGKDTEAAEALLAALRHPLPDVRREAVEHLTVVLDLAKGLASDQAIAAIEKVAHDDASFEPRFLARSALVALGREVPVDAPGKVYTLELRYGKAASRTLELLSEQTLVDLHQTILDSMGWDDDHLFSFYLSGNRDDERFTWPPEDRMDNVMELITASFEGEKPPKKQAEASRELLEEARLGALGFVPGDTFLYLFDFGDAHLFEIKVASIAPKANARVKYPRVTARKGNVKQYEDDEDF